jgi:hypothetical protein
MDGFLLSAQCCSRHATEGYIDKVIRDQPPDSGHDLRSKPLLLVFFDALIENTALLLKHYLIGRSVQLLEGKLGGIFLMDLT